MTQTCENVCQMIKQEQEERRECVKKGARVHPQLRKLDAFIMSMQQSEDAEHTKYLDWRHDVMEAVSCDFLYYFISNVSTHLFDCPQSTHVSVE